jgi:hypothetical protein
MNDRNHLLSAAPSKMMPRIRLFITFMLLTSGKALVRVHLAQKSSSPAVHQPSRAEFLHQASAAFGGLLLASSPSRADEEVPPKPPKIAACKAQGGGSPSNCVSTSSVKQVDCYLAPRTFDCKVTEAQARLKGVFLADPMRSAELSDAPSISDFGANRRRIDGIRKEAKVFDVMGGSYDAIESRGTGPMGQLKAFYGLQSGAGFEGLYED